MRKRSASALGAAIVWKHKTICARMRCMEDGDNKLVRGSGEGGTRVAVPLQFEGGSSEIMASSLAIRRTRALERTPLKRTFLCRLPASPPPPPLLLLLVLELLRFLLRFLFLLFFFFLIFSPRCGNEPRLVGDELEAEAEDISDGVEFYYRAADMARGVR